MRIVESAADVTSAVLAEAERTPDPRLRRILTSAIRHLHTFVGETELTEAEFRQICGLVARCGQLTNALHNATANLMEPFWRSNSPETPQGRVHRAIVHARRRGVRHRMGAPPRRLASARCRSRRVAGIGRGYYENQDPGQAEMNLRGRFGTAADGSMRFRTVKPSGYPISVNGPVGALGRHNLRPAHIDFLMHKPGYKTQFSQLYSSDDPNPETDVQFGVTRALIDRYAPTTASLRPIPTCAAAGSAWSTRS